MTATEGKYNTLSLAPYRRLFPPARVVDITVKKSADVSDTVAFIPEIISQTRWQVKDFVETELRGMSTEDALIKLWYWVKCHIPYAPDQRGKEQVKTPRRTVHDAWQGKGSDCDDMTTFVSCCASWLGGIKEIIHTISKYGGSGWQHIYPTVILRNGKRIIMDCVTDAYNYEKPPTQREEHIMDLELLDGIDDWNELGKLNLKSVVQNVTSAVKTAASNAGNAIQTAVKKTGEAIKDKADDILHAVNKVNPATVLLRNGVLAAMKVNMMNVAGRLRWAYLSDANVAKSGIDKGKHDKLKSIMAKLEDIFHGAGGEPKNLKAAILEGKGNKDHSVAGLDTLSIYSPLSEVLGPEIYHEEYASVQGLGELGEVATATSMAAATGAIATIAALIKQIGNLFPKGTPGAADFDAGDSETPDAPGTPSTASILTTISSAVNTVKQVLPVVPGKPVVPPPTHGPVYVTKELPALVAPAKTGVSLTQQRNGAVPAAPAVTTQFSPQTLPVQDENTQVFVKPTVAPPQNFVPMPDDAVKPATNTDDKKPAAKPSWVLPLAIGGGILVLAGAGYMIYRASQKKKLKGHSSDAVDGTGDEMGYVLVEETSPSETPKKPETETSPLEGFVLVEETNPTQAPLKAESSPPEGFVLVEETSNEEPEQLTAVPLM
ncbi:MAG TPA: hypothetical protein VD905_19620 [Flavobacteriales bacterium]|nr:hypothetical protein [Flavobacteriales bacterium]